MRPAPPTVERLPEQYFTRLLAAAAAARAKPGPRFIELGRGNPDIPPPDHAIEALCSAAHEPIPFRVLVEGEAPGASHGIDVDEDGNGVLRDGRLYQLVREHDGVRERTLQITFLEPGAEAYVFTFG